MQSQLRVLVGSLAPGVLASATDAELPDGTILLDLGPDHPSRAGLLELRLWVDDNVVTTAELSSALCIGAQRSCSRCGTIARF